MAMSCYSNWSFPQAESEVQMELLALQNSFLLDQNPSIDLIFEPHTNSQQIDSSYSLTKQTKLHEDINYDYTYLEQPSLVADESILYQDLITEFLPPLNCVQDLQCSFPVSSSGDNKVSVQSIAARKRRRRITDKTQELGKLIPGAHKMNTAEMFGAAYKYIQFLQAQVGILQLLNTIQDDEDDLQTRQLKQLVSSPDIQLKLYSSEKCLVTKRFVYSLQTDDHPAINSNSTVSKELQKLISDSG